MSETVSRLVRTAGAQLSPVVFLCAALVAAFHGPSREYAWAPAAIFVAWSAACAGRDPLFEGRDETATATAVAIVAMVLIVLTAEALAVSEEWGRHASFERGEKGDHGRYFSGGVMPAASLMVLVVPFVFFKALQHGEIKAVPLLAR